MNPGIHYDLDEKTYRDLPYAHVSGLKNIANSPAYYRWKKDHPTVSDAMIQGSAVGHLLAYGWESYLTKYVTAPASPESLPDWCEYIPPPFTGLKKADKELIAAKAAEGITIVKDSDFGLEGLKPSTNAGEAWVANAKKHGLQPLTAETSYNVEMTIAAIRRHPLAGPIVETARHEVSVIWDDEETGVRCKGRIDLMRDGRLDDLKTTQDCRAFNRTVERYCYHWQAAMYLDGAIANGMSPDLEWGWIVAEPHTTFRVEVSEPLSIADIEVGRDEYRAALRLYKRCMDADSWPASAGVPVRYGLSRWYGK